MGAPGKKPSAGRLEPSSSPASPAARLALFLALLLGAGVALRAPLAAHRWLVAAPPPPYSHPAAEWHLAPAGAAFTTPYSRCSILGDGSVRVPPPPPPAPPASGEASAGLPFLFNLSAATLPPQEETCAGCPRHSCSELPATLPAACCGVCVFEKRLCSAQYPGQRKSERIAAQFAAAQGGDALHRFTPCELFQRIRGRTLWLIGDSQTWHFFYAVECFMREFAVTMRRSPPLQDASLVDQLTTADIKLCYQPFPVPPICLELAHGTRVCTVRVDSAAGMAETVLPLLARHSPGFRDDLVVLNTGLHYSSKALCPKQGRPCKVPGPKSAYVRDLKRLAAYREEHRRRLPRMLWMDTPPQHWPGSGSFSGSYHSDRCEPLDAAADPAVAAGGMWNAAAAPLVPRLGDAHLAIWNASAPLWDSHVPGECTHSCQPGSYHLWLYQLNRVLSDSGLGSRVRVDYAQAGRGAAAAAAQRAARGRAQRPARAAG